MTEIQWKKIDGFDRYSVSNKGDVRNDDTGLILKTQYDKNGYVRINLRKKGKKDYHIQIHRAVAMAFIGPPPVHKPQIDHIDRVKTNNCVENLRYVSNEENQWNKSNTHIEFVDSISEESVPIDGYNSWVFDELYYDPVVDEVFKLCDSGKWRKINKRIQCSRGCSYCYIDVLDMDGKHRQLSFKKLIRLLGF